MQSAHRPNERSFAEKSKHMHDTILPGTEQSRLLAALPPDERCIAEGLLKAAPNYRYEMSGLPEARSAAGPWSRIRRSGCEGDDGVGQVAADRLTVSRLSGSPLRWTATNDGRRDRGSALVDGGRG
jgi:hypothetical protein